MTSSIVPQATQVTDGSIRCYFYARYSSDNQSEASIPDQFRNCRELARRKGWTVLEHLNQSDEEMTGRTKFGKKGLEALMAIAKAKPKVVDYLICDDTSRFGRNAAETLQLANVLRFHGISLYFVEDGLDSREPSFWDSYSRKVVEDERYSRSMGSKIRRGRRGRFLDGFNPGGGCYGYRNVPIYDHSRKGFYGMPFVKAVLQEIDPETSRIVLRIFNAYADGMSYKKIAAMLNDEDIPTSQEPRSKRERSWSRNAIRSMLTNTRYIGRITWGKTREKIDPESGKRVREDLPVEQWDSREAPELRIIPDDLWTKVQSIRTEKVAVGIQKTGGMNRTEASRRYLFSGLLRCGVCDSDMNVQTSNPVRYGCSAHRNRGEKVCTNRTSIKQEDLERSFLAALGDKLRSDQLREELVQTLYVHLSEMKNRQLEADEAALAQKDEMEANRAKYLRHQANLLKAIREEGGCRSLYEDLKDVEARVARIDELLATSERPPIRPITLEEVRTFVENEAHRFEELLLGSAEHVKAEFQRRITAITLTPGIGEQGPIYTVTGDVDLFSLPNCLLQTNQLHLIGLHHTIPIAFEVVPYGNHLKWALPQAA
jgi:DNA invertase Pin-like site-specific DNA recombinase